MVARQPQAGEPPSRHIIARGGAGHILICGLLHLAGMVLAEDGGV